LILYPNDIVSDSELILDHASLSKPFIPNLVTLASIILDLGRKTYKHRISTVPSQYIMNVGDDRVCVCTVQVIMKLMEMMDQSSDFVSMLVKKLAPPLVTLLSAEPEIQYVALRNINLVVQKRYFTVCDIVTVILIFVIILK